MEADFLQSLNFARMIDDSRMELDNICMLAKISIQKKDIKKAGYYLKEGESLINVGAPFNVEIIKIYSQLSELYLMIDNFERVAFYQAQYIRLKYSIFNEAVTTNLMEIESKYLQRENQARIAAQDEIILLKEQMIYRQSLLSSYNIVAVTAIALMVILYRSYLLKKRINSLLEEKIRPRTKELDDKVGALFNKSQEKEIKFNRFFSLILGRLTRKGFSSNRQHRNPRCSGEGIFQNSPIHPNSTGAKYEAFCQKRMINQLCAR